MSAKRLTPVLLSTVIFVSGFSPVMANATNNMEQPILNNGPSYIIKEKKTSNAVSAVLKEHRDLMLFGSNTPGKETYDFRKTTDIVKEAGVYTKWKNSKDYTNFHEAWKQLSAEEKQLPEMKEVYAEYRAAKTYLQASDAIFAYYNVVKTNASSIALKGKNISNYITKKEGLRKKALDAYETYYTTSGEKKTANSRRAYINNKYAAVVAFLQASTTLASSRDSIPSASSNTQVTKITNAAKDKVTEAVKIIGNYSSTFTNALEKSLSSVKTIASTRKKEFIYAVGTVSSSGAIKLTNNEYSTFAEANKKFGANEVLIFKDTAKNKVKILKTNAGIVSVKTTTASVYSDTSLKNAITYNAKGNELLYLETVNEKVVKVKIADTVGYMKMSESNILPNDMVKEHSYYMNKNGKLYHYIYNQATKEYIGGYVIGEEVGSLKENTKYYSLNGVDFYTAGGKKVTSLNKKNLYQFMNAATKNTKYTAADINNYLKAVKPDSLMIGQGKYFIEAGEKYNINPILLFVLANHESNYGTNELAKTKKNLFSINAVDSNPLEAANTYKTFKDAIYQAAEFITSKYMNSSDWRYEGSYFGNKSSGFNVQYASDPFWGQKVAGHYYRFVQWVESNK